MSTSEYDISRAFKRIENDLIDSMMRNMRRHQVEEAELGKEWEQWQALQLAELEEFRKKNTQLFSGDFTEIQENIEDALIATYADAQAKEERALLDHIRKGEFRPTEDKGGFFRLNEQKMHTLIMATQADFARAEYAMLRRANDQYRQIIFDSMVYANVTNDYKKAVDMATHDFLKRGIDCVVYKNGARHTVSDYASMALRTGNKRAYLMGEGNAHDRYGLHTVRVNKRQHACPKCVGFLGRLLINDVYGGGTRAEAVAMGIPTLSDAMQAGFLHPNCKDIYSAYIDGVSKPAKPWTKEEIEAITGNYNTEQQIKHAEDMRDTYNRMAKYSLDPENQQRYQTRADNWQTRIDELQNVPPKVVIPPQVTPPKVVDAVPFTDDEKEALEWYVSGDGMWINQYLRGNGDFGELDKTEKTLLDLLTGATEKPLDNVDTLYRSVDASVIFEGLTDDELYQMTDHILHGNYDNGAYSQSIKRKMEQAIKDAQGKTLTEKGFMSTTVDKKVAEEWGEFTDAQHPIVLELDTKGSQLKGANLDFLDVEGDPQRERLLARNTRYKITDIGVGESEEGYKYVKVKAEIIDQAEEAVETVAEEVVETVTPPMPSEEELIRSRISDIKSRSVDKLLKEADDEKKRLEEYYDSYINVKVGAEASGADIAERLLKQAEKYRLKGINDNIKMFTEWAEKYRYIYDNLQDFENGTYLDDVTARIKALKKQDRAIQKELDKEYNALEAVIGEPNVSRLSDYKEKNTNRIKRFLDDAPTVYRNLWNEFADNFRTLSINGKGAYYSASMNGVKLSINSASKGSTYQTPYQVVFHEFGHSIDWELNRKYGNGKRMESFTSNYKGGIFGKTVQEEANEALEKFAKEQGLMSTPNKGTVVVNADKMVQRGLLRQDEKAEWIRNQLQSVQIDRTEAEKKFCEYIIGKYTLLQRTDISDMFESIMTTTDYPFGVGHGKRYWGSVGNSYKKCGQEAFAEMYSAVIANEESWEVIQEFFPRSVEIFKEIIEVDKL